MATTTTAAVLSASPSTASPSTASPSTASPTRSVTSTAVTLLSLGDLSLQPTESGTELKWCVFARGIRGSIGKIIVDVAGPMTAHVRVVFVRKEFRGNNLGTVLMQHAQQALVVNGFETLVLDAEEDTSNHGKLVAMYQRCGFQVTPGVKETYEYNGEQTFRKVRMCCNLKDVARRSDLENLGFEFAQAMRLEAGEFSRRRPLGLTVVQAVLAIDKAAKGTLMRSLLSAREVRLRGHPDWMELAAGLRFIGKVQLLFAEWRTPYAVAVRPAVGNDVDDGERPEMTKSGPLPSWASPEVTTVVAPDRYPPGIGLEEVALSWSDAEMSYILLNRDASLPPEVAMLLRYHRFKDWIQTGVNVFARENEARFLHLLRLFADALAAVDQSPSSCEAVDEDIELRRFSFLVDKYLSLSWKFI